MCSYNDFLCKSFFCGIQDFFAFSCPVGLASGGGGGAEGVFVAMKIKITQVGFEYV